MRPPSRRLASSAGTARPPPLGRQGAAPGDESAPPTPPPLPLRPKSRPKNGRPRTPPEEAAAPGHHGRGKRPHALRAAGQRRTGGTQDGAVGAAPSEAGPGKTGANQGGEVPPPSPPPPPRTDPLTADQTAPDDRGRPATPTARAYPGGARRRQQMAGRRPTGRGGGDVARSPYPSLRATGATLGPPGAEGTPPLPQKGPRRGDWGCCWTCTPRTPAPPAACSRGGRGRQASPHQRAGAARGPSPGGGAQQRTRTVWRPRPP